MSGVPELNAENGTVFVLMCIFLGWGICGFQQILKGPHDPKKRSKTTGLNEATFCIQDKMVNDAFKQV